MSALSLHSAATTFLMWIAFFSSPPDLTLHATLLGIINDDSASTTDRIDAEMQLREIADAEFLPMIFENIGEPIRNEFGHLVSTPEAYALYPGTGIAEQDAEVLPVSAQIAYARLRIWDTYAREGQPEDIRAQILVELFDVECSDFQLQQLVRASRANWSENTRKQLVQLAVNTNANEYARTQASNVLIELGHSTPRSEFADIRTRLVDAAWMERGSQFSHRVGSRVRDRNDSRVAILRIESYESEKAAAAHRGQSINLHYAENVDGYFGITGLGDQQRSAPTAQEREDMIRLAKLQRQARDSGDDSEFRQLEVEVEQRRRQELELRIERIDAWIAENRERLEREAEEFAEQRQRERELAE